MKRALLLVLVVLGFGSLPHSDRGHGRVGLTERLLGPVSSLAASAYWVRFDMALRDGEPSRAYALAERALDLEPGAWQGWSNLALHLIFDRASAELEPDPARRRRWVRAGLEVLERGTETSRRPGELYLIAGLVGAAHIGPRSGSLEWPGGAISALEDAVLALEQADALGQPRASELLAEARMLLVQVRRGEHPESWGEEP